MKNEVVNEIVNIACKGVCDIYNLIGTGEKRNIDYIATKRYDDLLNVFTRIRVLAYEGERDGINISRLQTQKNPNDNCVQIVIDPIDGTKACSLGGSRVLSAVAIDSKGKQIYKIVPDSLSCFYVASNVRGDFVNNLDFIGTKREKIQESIQNISNFSTMRRQESEELWSWILHRRYKKEIGEEVFYLPNMVEGPLFYAGDSSISLFLESDNFIGRTGATEARIEARLWKYWKGILVSGKKIKKYKAGFLEYMRNRILAATYPENFLLQDFFEDYEIIQLNNCGWTKKEILEMLEPDGYAPNYDFILVASITGTQDRVLCQHSPQNLCKTVLDLKNDILTIPMWIKTDGVEEVINYDYNILTGEIYGKRKIL